MARQTMARPTAATLLRAGDLDGLASLVTACGCSQQPRSFFNFSSASSGAEALELATPCLGLSSYSLWAWVKLDAQPAKEAVEPRLIFALHGGGQSVELVVNDLRLSVQVSQKGTLSALQCEKPLTAGTWHLIMCDHAAPPRRLLPFMRGQMDNGVLRMFVDGLMVSEGPLLFPSPTSGLRKCRVGSADSDGTRALNGQLAELVVLPSATDPDTAAEAVAMVGMAPCLTLHEAAQRCVLKPSLCIHPHAISLPGDAAALPPRLPLNTMVVHTQDVRDELVALGGVRVPLLLIGRLQPLEDLPDEATSHGRRRGSSADGLGSGRQLTENPMSLTSLLIVLQALVCHRPAAQAQMQACNGAAVLGSLLRKVPTSQLTQVALQQLESLIDAISAMADTLQHAKRQMPGGRASVGIAALSSSGSSRESAAALGSLPSSSSATLGSGNMSALLVPVAGEAPTVPTQVMHDQLVLCCLCDFRIWARASADVQMAHLRMLKRRVQAAGGAAPLLSALTVQHVLDALRGQYTGRTGQLLTRVELRAVRSEAAALAGALTPTVSDAWTLVQSLRASKETLQAAPLLEVMAAWIRGSAEAVASSDGARAVPSVRNSPVKAAGREDVNSPPSSPELGATTSMPTLLLRGSGNARRSLLGGSPGEPTAGLGRRSFSSVPSLPLPAAAQYTLDALAE